MLWRRKRAEVKPGKSSSASPAGAVEIGWLISANEATFIYDRPRRVKQDSAFWSTSPKAASRCPAVAEFESRFFQLACPVDLRLRIVPDKKGQLALLNAAGKQSPVAPAKLKGMVELTEKDRWRHPERPIIQIAAPWRFLCDEPVWMSQTPPFGAYMTPPWPGLVMAGRFPIHLWPRTLNWAFEWHDLSKELRLKRNMPWFYVGFETASPERPVRLVEAEMSRELEEYCKGLDQAVSYVSQTFQLLEVARQRRPARLLQKKRS